MTNVLQLYDNELKRLTTLFNCNAQDITVINTNNLGMTNKNVVIRIKDELYMIRFPDESSLEVIDRVQERKVHKLLQLHNFDPLTIKIVDDGLKITKYVENAHVCDTKNWNEVEKCMKLLRQFHELKLQPELNKFDCLERARTYRKLAKVDDDDVYRTILLRCERVAEILEDDSRCCILSHIDSAPVNFLFVKDKHAEPILIDWEYAALHDPLLDIASFAINANYTNTKINNLCNAYFTKSELTTANILRVKAYCALLGLTWYNWCIYEEIHFDKKYEEYRNRMLNYADEMSKFVLKEYIK